MNYLLEYKATFLNEEHGQEHEVSGQETIEAGTLSMAMADFIDQLETETGGIILALDTKVEGE